MPISLIDVATLHLESVAALGLDNGSLDLDSPEALCALLRVAASYSCPCSSISLRRQVVKLLQGIVVDEALPERLDGYLDDLLGYGDLLEVARTDDRGQDCHPLTFIGPPRCVRLSDRTLLLVGLHSRGLDAFPDEIARRIESKGHVRMILTSVDEALEQQLADLGVPSMSLALWLQAPDPVTSEKHLATHTALLNRSSPGGSASDLEVLNPATAVRHYRGRWKPPTGLTGAFVAKREQRYGNALWCYVELDAGFPHRLLDLGINWRGCDEAWHLQMAIDSVRGTPQQFRLTRAPNRHTAIVEVFGPLPQWAQRRLDTVGERVNRHGSLIAYSMDSAEADAVEAFLQERLWLVPFTQSTRNT